MPEQAQTKRPLLFTYFESSELLLLAEYKRSKLQKASQNLGSNRELFCNSFLEKVLPHKLKITKGEIWDSRGNKTGQLDTIIVRDDTPSLTFGDANTYLAEGVFAVIEIKSNLTRDKLREAIKTLLPLKPCLFIAKDSRFLAVLLTPLLIALYDVYSHMKVLLGNCYLMK